MKKPRQSDPTRIVLYGLHPVWETIKAGRRRVDRVYVAQGSAAGKRISAELHATGIEVVRASSEEIAELAGSPYHQGIAAAVGPFRYAELEHVLDSDRTAKEPVVLLDEVQDPGNLGSILRTGECLGVRAVVLTRDRSVAVTPAVEKASAGASAHVPVVRVTNMVRTLEELKKAGYWIYSAEARASRSCFLEDLSGPVAFVVGSEGKGVRRLVREHCDIGISIPMKGRIDSLNVAQAVTVLLAEALRQRGAS
ncbi:MAG: 23S rRNA (guanosine(2251)-2'-O)-methyltransferase RlmB [Thermodesulfobacteriota bacterium]